MPGAAPGGVLPAVTPLTTLTRAGGTGIIPLSGAAAGLPGGGLGTPDVGFTGSAMLLASNNCHFVAFRSAKVAFFRGAKGDTYRWEGNLKLGPEDRWATSCRIKSPRPTT